MTEGFADSGPGGLAAVGNSAPTTHDFSQRIIDPLVCSFFSFHKTQFNNNVTELQQVESGFFFLPPAFWQIQPVRLVGIFLHFPNIHDTDCPGADAMADDLAGLDPITDGGVIAVDDFAGFLDRHPSFKWVVVCLWCVRHSNSSHVCILCCV